MENIQYCHENREPDFLCADQGMCIRSPLLIFVIIYITQNDKAPSGLAVVRIVSMVGQKYVLPEPSIPWSDDIAQKYCDDYYLESAIDVPTGKPVTYLRTHGKALRIHMIMNVQQRIPITITVKCVWCCMMVTMLYTSHLSNVNSLYWYTRAGAYAVPERAHPECTPPRCWSIDTTASLTHVGAHCQRFY